jgi:hypothetical protein
MGIMKTKFPKTAFPPLSVLYSYHDMMLSFLEKNRFSDDNTPWWVKITSISPHCLYYFGPFASFDEAQQHQAGYLQDIESEGAQGISLSIERSNPHYLTVFEDENQDLAKMFTSHARTFSRFIS